MKTPQPKTQPVPPEQGGQSLVTILMLGALLAFFGATLTRMLMNEAKQVVETKKRDKLFTAGDAALQRSLGVLLQSDANWNAPQALTGFNSLSVTAFADIPGLTYYVKVLPGTLEDQNGAGAADDAAVEQWVNVGSLTHDRTIFVRAIDQTTKQEDRFFTTVHRTPPSPNPGAKGIQAAGSANLAGWDGVVYDSCPGGIGGSAAPNPVPVPGDQGEVIAPVITGGNSFQLTKKQGDPGELPPATLPTTAPLPEPMPGNTSVSQNASGSKNLGPSSGPKGTPRRYQVANLTMGGGTTYHVNASNGPIELYVTGSFTLSGNVNIVTTTCDGASPPNCWSCCTAKGFTVYMVGGGTVTWNGTPTGTMVLYGPQSTMNMNGTGNGNYKGAVTVNNLNVSGGGSGVFHYDKCLSKRGAADNYESPPLVTTQWQQIGSK
jgi:hypothetical protein